MYIPNFLQNTIFNLLLFALMTLKKIRNRAGYYSSFSKSSAQKSSRLKHRILKKLGYIPKICRRFFFISSVLLLSGCISGIWTGANLFYDRHNVYHSLSDYELVTIARHALYKDNYFKCAECHIDLAVFNGDLLLAGHVETAEMREEAYRRVMTHPDYRRVFKKISIEPIRTHIARDTWITGKIRSQVIADSEINPRAFKILTSDQIVYLMGDVMPDQAEWVVSIARNTSGVKRVVKLFQYYHLSNKA